MICRKCGNFKTESEMFKRSVRGIEQTLDICKECHSLASSQGARSRIKNADGYLLAICSVMQDHIGHNEMIYLTFCNRPSIILHSIRNVLLSPVIVYGQWKTDKLKYHEIIDAAKLSLYRGKWYYFSPKIKQILMELN